MKKFILLTALASASLAIAAQASIVMNLQGGTYQTAASAPVAAGTLFQLIDLGADGVFNSINLNDGSTAGNAAWVSGDDSVISASFGAADFSSAAGFDLIVGADPSTGYFNRVFNFASGVLAKDIKIGIRWFPGLQATNQASITLQTGQAFGQFTRQSNPLHGGTLWTIPADGSNVTLDSMATASIGGFDANTVGVASFIVVPEPTTAGLFGIGALGLLLRRRRQA